MSLYSWFSRTNTKPKIKRINNELIKASKSVKYIENYTMWPTASIKPHAEITPPSFTNVNGTQPNNTTTILPTEPTLSALKN